MARREAMTVRDKRISYLIEGSGLSLVLLAPALESADSWAELGYLDAFADRYRVVAIDLFGQGHSDRSTDPADYSWEELVEQISAVCDAESVREGGLWGYGNGAETALGLARRRPDVAGALVLGGLYLGEARVLWDARGVDHDATVEAMAAALDDGDWDGYFDLLPIEWGERARERARTRCDPAAMAAGTRGDLTRPRALVSPGVSSLAYWGAEVFFAGANADLALSLPIESLVVPGNEGDAFLDPEPVIEAVGEFLDRVLLDRSVS